MKIIIHIQETAGLPYRDATLYFYHEAGEQLMAVPVDRIPNDGGILTYQNRTDWQQVFDTGRDLYTFDGVAVVYNENHYYIGDFQDRSRKGYTLTIVKKPEKPEVTVIAGKAGNSIVEEEPDRQSRTEQEERITDRQSGTEQEEEITDRQSGTEQEERITDRQSGTEQEERIADRQSGTEQAEEIADRQSGTEQVEGVTDPQSGAEQAPDISLWEDMVAKQEDKSSELYTKCRDCPYNRKRKEQGREEDAFARMLEEYPKLPMYGATELFDCVRIHPRDIGQLDMRNWKLGVNSFLTHGFYTYQYLLLGKMRFDDGTEHPILGVPGVYSNREKYLANMFGFEQFIPVKKTGVKTGTFGYWIVEISPYLK